MAHRPKIPASQRRGYSAESEILSRLKNFSVPAKPEPDIGIDFYCQLLERDSPTSRFFGVQAKGTKHFHKTWHGSFRKETIILWLLLRFPVFIIVYEKESGNCYWKSIVHIQSSLINKLGGNRNTISISIDRSNILQKEENGNIEFIRCVKEAQSLISLISGYPQFGEGYVRRLPIISLPKGVITNLRQNIRTSLKFLISDSLLKKDTENAYFLCKFLARFDKGHYDHFMILGGLEKLRGNREEAKRNFEQAIRICERDKSWNKLKAPSDPSIEEIIISIRKEIDRLGIG